MTIKKDEKGQPFRIGTGFDMSGSTSLTIKFTKPDGTELTVTNPDVTAPATPLVNDPYLGSIPASTYFEYTSTGLDFDQAGENWKACGTYADASLTLFTGEVTFTIDESCA